MNYSACDGGTIELLVAALFDQIYVSNHNIHVYIYMCNLLVYQKEIFWDNDYL